MVKYIAVYSITDSRACLPISPPQESYTLSEASEEIIRVTPMPPPTLSSQTLKIPLTQLLQSLPNSSKSKLL